MKKVLLTLLLSLLVAINANAVLKEKNLGHTIHVLRLELYNKWYAMKEDMKEMKQRNDAQHRSLIEYKQRANTARLMLYSQGQEFTFDIAYACQEATTLYRKISNETRPYKKIKLYIQSDIARYDSLIYALQTLPPSLIKDEDLMLMPGPKPKMMPKGANKMHKADSFILDKQGQADRAECVRYAQDLRNALTKIYDTVKDDEEEYNNTADQIRNMYNYAQKKYSELQQSIFVNPGSNYFRILMSAPMQIKRMRDDFDQKYLPLKEKPGKNVDTKKMKLDKNGEIVYPSEWRGGVVLFASLFMLFYIFVAAIISNIILRWLMPARYRNRDAYKKKRPMFIMTGAVFIFSIAVMIARNWIDHNLMLMATSLMIEMAWLMGTIYVSMLIRLNANQMKEGAKLYDPFIFTSLIVVWFRIILIPNTLVNLIFPPILLIFTIWQIFTLQRCKKKVPTTDRVCCSVSLAAMIVATVLSFIGFTLMAVQLLLWWMFQLAAIATITCVYDLMEMYEDKVMVRRIKKEHGDLSNDAILSRMRKGRYVGKTWMYDFINRALIPVCAVFSILFSVFMAAEIFDLRDLCMKWFMTQFPITGADGKTTLFSASAFKISLVVALYYIFKYLNYLVRSIWFSLKRNIGDDDFNATLSRNIIGIFIWGIYIIACFIIMKVPSTGITVVMGGLATGLGFASQSLLENFFYGISLMSGRVRVGDYIECEGITGKVESITYQSTQIITLDGSVVAIRNADLFSKNFKNLTRNHQYVLVKIPIGVAYGANINNVREMLIKGVSKLCKKTDDGRDLVKENNSIKVALSDFGDSSVNLQVMAWVLVDQKLGFIAEVNEIIYNVLNENHIEIPFPQTDVHMRND